MQRTWCFIIVNVNFCGKFILTFFALRQKEKSFIWFDDKFFFSSCRDLSKQSTNFYYLHIVPNYWLVVTFSL